MICRYQILRGEETLRFPLQLVFKQPGSRAEDYSPILLLLNSPNNPTGCVYREQDLKELAAKFREYGIIVLSDEIYRSLTHGSSQEDAQNSGIAPSIADYYDRCIQAYSVSKMLAAGGWRIGVLAFQPALREYWEKCCDFAGSIYTCPSPLLEPVLVRMLHGLKGEDKELTAYWAAQRNVLTEAAVVIEEELQDTAIRWTPMCTGWYTLLNLEAYRPKMLEYHDFLHMGEDVAYHLAEELGVVMVPGAACGLAEELFYLRFSYIDIVLDGNGGWSTHRIKDLCRVLKEWLEPFAPDPSP